MTSAMSADRQAIMPACRALVSGPFKRRLVVVTNRKMYYGTFHQGTPRVSDAGASDFDIYISANDVSETHFHIYAYKYTARTARVGPPRHATTRLRHVNWGTKSPSDSCMAGLEKDINPQRTSWRPDRRGIVQFEWHRGTACGHARLIVNRSFSASSNIPNYRIYTASGSDLHAHHPSLRTQSVASLMTKMKRKVKAVTV